MTGPPEHCPHGASPAGPCDAAELCQKEMKDLAVFSECKLVNSILRVEDSVFYAFDACMIVG